MIARRLSPDLPVLSLAPTRRALGHHGRMDLVQTLTRNPNALAANSTTGMGTLPYDEVRLNVATQGDLSGQVWFLRRDLWTE
jgi:hypothetical protein